MKSLKEQWSAFAGVILEPFNLLLLAGLVGLFAISGRPNSGVSPDLMFVLITIAAAVLGGRIAQQWAAATDQGIVGARGRAAVRNLKVLLRNIAALESRLRDFRKEETQIKDNPDVTKRNYDEAIGRCGLLEEEAVNSIENWTDIVPEADIKTQIGRISELQAELAATTRDLAATKESLQEIKGRSANDAERLRLSIRKMEDEKQRLIKELRDRSYGLSGLGITASAGTAKLSDFLGALNAIKAPDRITLSDGDVVQIQKPDDRSLKISMPEIAKVDLTKK